MNDVATRSLAIWQEWGSLAGFVVALGAAFWVFYDAQRSGRTATISKVFVVVAPILVMPSVVFRLAPDFQSQVANAVIPLSSIGMGAVGLAVIVLAAYLAGLPSEGRRCPNCNQPMLPDWDRCPYCAPVSVSTNDFVSPPPPPPPPVPTRPVVDPVPRPVAIDPPPTEVLRREPPTMAWLVLKSGVHAGHVFELRSVSVVGSRASESDVALDDPAVSREHAKIRLREHDQFTITDLDSTNGTFLLNHETGEWERIEKHVLQDHDQIKVGETVLAFMQLVRKEVNHDPA